jgi:hypothetical protein
MRYGLLLALVPIAITVGVGAMVAGALLTHRVLVITIGEEQIPAFDNTIGMRILVAADYIGGALAGIAVLVVGWVRVIRPGGHGVAGSGDDGVSPKRDPRTKEVMGTECASS